MRNLSGGIGTVPILYGNAARFGAPIRGPGHVDTLLKKTAEHLVAQHSPALGQPQPAAGGA